MDNKKYLYVLINKDMWRVDSIENGGTIRVKDGKFFKTFEARNVESWELLTVADAIRRVWYLLD